MSRRTRIVVERVEVSRFLAGVADKAVELFAGGKRHWGNDGYEVADL